MQEEILLRTSPSDLTAICTTSPDLYSLCSSPGFWKRRLQEEGLPVPEKMFESFSQWYLWYKAGLNTQEFFSHPFPLYANFSLLDVHLSDFPLLDTREVREFLDGAEERMDRTRSLEEERERLAELGVSVEVLSDIEEEIIKGEVEDVRAALEFEEEDTTLVFYEVGNACQSVIYTNIIWEEAEELVFNLFYFSIPFIEEPAPRSYEEGTCSILIG